MGCAASTMESAAPCSEGVPVVNYEPTLVDVVVAEPANERLAPLKPSSAAHLSASKGDVGHSDSQQPGWSRASTKASTQSPSPSAPPSPSLVSLSAPSLLSLSERSTVSTSSAALGQRVALGRYVFDSKAAPLGEGASSVCYLGTDVQTGGKVAVKAYKVAAAGTAKGEACRKQMVTMFRRQVNVLLQLQKPLQRPADARLWSPELVRARPSDLFVQMLDYSRDSHGEPGPDAADGSMYVVTELAEQTLKSFLKEHYEHKRPLPAEEVRKIAKEVTLAMAGLHAKGLVHMDMKPENIMFCSGRWKLIDMDCCFKIGSVVRIDDAAVSFSPCYCSPEFARFVNGGNSILASPALDVWSIGMTLGELVELCPLFRATYQQIAKGVPRKEGSTRFLRWLGQLSSAPKLTKTCDRSFQKLLQEALLVPKQVNRMTLAESLSAPFFR